MPPKYRPIRLKGNYICQGCSKYTAVRVVGKWKVLAKGQYEEQEFSYDSCEQCDNEVRQTSYDKAYRAMKARNET